MASNHISISSVTRIGAGVNGAIEEVRRARQEVSKYYGIMSEFADDLTALAAELGVTEAQASVVKANFLNAKGVLEGADINYLINRLGQ